MDLIVAVSILVSSLVMILFQLARNFRSKVQPDIRSKMLPWILMPMVITILVNVICSRTLTVFSLLCDLVPGICSVMLLSLTVWNGKAMLKASVLYLLIDLALVCQYVFTFSGLIPVVPDILYLYVSEMSVFVMVILVICGIWRFLFNVKVVLRSGTVWHAVCLSVETVYLLVAVSLVSASAGALLSGEGASVVLVYIPVLLLWLELMALSFRINNDSMMIFCHRMERRIIESLKVAAVEIPNDVTKSDTAYQEIYDRIVAYFEQEKPYLRNDLIIDDLVKVVFSNKLYISRAISQITGRNFCQFVNYYRIMYSVELFRSNPELKATELASLCGFNSLVSFSMAFRLYMNENPSDWIRKERTRKAKSGLMSAN